MSNYRENVEKDMRYLELLAQSFPTVAAASTEIINLQAILNLPKGTEHFLADLHGAFPPFQHVLKNASGNIKRKVSELFGNEIRESDKRELCTLIYYPEQKLELVKQTETDMNDWYHITIHQLVRVCRDVSSKYTRSKVRKALPEDFSYIIQELLHERTEDTDKAAYVKMIINSIIDTGRADDFTQGKVTRAEISNKGTTLINSEMREKAKQAALRSAFAADTNAPDEQHGTITYTFVINQ